MPQSVFQFRIGQRLPIRRALVLAAATSLTAAIFATAGALAQVPPVGATAEVRDAAGRLVANAEFREGRGEALITIVFPSVASLTGTHAMHIMQTGRCDAPDFLTAGTIFNPLNKKHGRQNPEGPMVGDLPNVNFTTGLTSYNTSANGATLGQGVTSLLGANATALVIHSGEDDQLTDPDGKSGSRIACGVITAAPGLSAQLITSPVPQVAAPRFASPAPVQPAVQPPVAQPPAVQPPVAQQPAKPSASPIVVQGVVPKPASPVVAIAAAASPTAVTVAQPVVPVVPTVPPVAANPNPQSSGGLGPVPALLIAILGVGLVGAGYLMRRRSQLRG